MTFANIEYFFSLASAHTLYFMVCAEEQEERTYVVGIGYDGIPLCAQEL